MNYKKAYKPAKGYTPICKIGECSLKKLEFGIIELCAGESVNFNTEDKKAVDKEKFNINVCAKELENIYSSFYEEKKWYINYIK